VAAARDGHLVVSVESNFAPSDESIVRDGGCTLLEAQVSSMVYSRQVFSLNVSVNPERMKLVARVWLAAVILANRSSSL
jgi:hypothetical protein